MYLLSFFAGLRIVIANLKTVLIISFRLLLKLLKGNPTFGSFGGPGAFVGIPGGPIVIPGFVVVTLWIAVAVFCDVTTLVVETVDGNAGCGSAPGIIRLLPSVGGFALSSLLCSVADFCIFMLLS